MATYRAVSWKSSSELVRSRRLRHMVENAEALNDQKVTLSYVDNGAVTKHGVQRGKDAITVTGSPTTDSTTISFNTTTDGVKFTATPQIMVNPHDTAGGFPPLYIYYVTAASTSGATISVRNDNGVALSNTDYQFNWVAVGPVGGI